MSADRLIPVTHIIRMLVNNDFPERHVTAISEFIDNALGEGAGNAENVLIEFNPDKVSITDDGVGISDLNALFTLGDSRSQFDERDIGQFGYGAKAGALYLAFDMEVETVHNGLYHSYRVDWEQVKNSREWPRRYDRKGVPTNLALGGIHQGTRVTLRRRHPGRVWQGEALAQHLAHIYRPGLLAGSRITLAQGRGATKRIWELHKFLGALHLDIRASGRVGEKTFELRAGRVRNLSARLNGVHIAFGPRFIVTERELISRHIPAQLYAEVMLSREWKESLSASKSALAHNREELLREVERLLTPLIDELENEAFEIEIKGFIIEIGQEAEKLLDAASDGAGQFGEGIEGQRGEGHGGKRTNPEPGRGNLKPSASDHGQRNRSEEALRQKKTGLTVELSSGMGTRVTKVSIAATGARVTLNRDLLYIRLVKKDKAGILWTIFHALLDECIRDETQARLFPTFRKYREFGESPFDAKEHVLYDLLKAHEPAMTRQ